MFNGSRVVTYQQLSALLGFNRDRFGGDRRAWMYLRFGSAMLAAALMLGVASATVAAPDVRVESGRLRGAEADGVRAFLGIPFAAPPVGALRWRAPQPASRWTGLREA